MGFALLGSLGSYVSVRDSRHWNVRFQSFTLKERFVFGFNLAKNFRAYKKFGRVSLCKSEFVDFEERTSPNEVILIFTSTQTVPSPLGFTFILAKTLIFVLIYDSCYSLENADYIG